MSYLTAGQLKDYKGVTGSADDTLLGELIAAAQLYIENYTHRVFEAAADSTRYFDVGKHTEGATLYLDRDLCAITSITNNADGTTETLATTDYVTIPRSAPYQEIKLLTSKGKYWRYTNDPENAIVIVGKWAYATVPPYDIVQACRRLATYYFTQKDAQVFDVTALPEMGQIIIPQGVPADIRMLLAPYVRPVI